MMSVSLYMTNITYKTSWSAFKKLLLALFLFSLTGLAIPAAKADDHHGYYRRHGHHGYDEGRGRRYRSGRSYNRHRHYRSQRRYYRNGRRYYGYNGNSYYNTRPGVSVNIGL